MKRYLSYLLVLTLLLTGCSNSEPVETVPGQTTAVTETTIPTETEPERQQISQEMAMLEGYVVMEDMDVRHNQQNWFIFLEQTRAGESAEISIINYFYTENGWSQSRYDLFFDGTLYTVKFMSNEEELTVSAEEIIEYIGTLDDFVEPYDSYIRYCLSDLVLYQDLIAEPNFEGVNEIALHSKEGEPPVQVYADENAVNAILALLSNAEYLPCEPSDYLYCMKLIVTNAEDKELIIELDYRYGNFRYGTQTYHYGELSDLFAVLQINHWPDSVIAEFDAYLNS